MKPNPNYTHLEESVPKHRFTLLQGGTRCFVGDTLVFTTKGYKKIKDIVRGDYVFSWKQGSIAPKKVVDKFRYRVDQHQAKTLTFTGDKFKIECTYDHKLLFDGKWVKASVIAKRIMDSVRGEIRSVKHGEVSNIWQTYDQNRLPESSAHESSQRQRRIFANGNKRKNIEDPSISSKSVLQESASKAFSEPHQRNKIRQQGGESGVGDTQREYRSRSQVKSHSSEQWFQERYEQAYREKGEDDKAKIRAVQGYDEGFSDRIQGVQGSDKGCVEWKDLATCKITKIETKHAVKDVYDIEVEDFHSYLVTKQNIVSHNSGKTYSIIYYIINLCRNFQGLEIDICRDTFTSLKSTVWKDFKQVLMIHGDYDVSNHNKTDKYYSFNGNIISYYGADDPKKIHGRSRDILWLNEAHQLEKETIDQLFTRTKHKIIMDYNPALPGEHWLDDYIDEYPPFITTYRDNPYLTEGQIMEIERRKKNPYWWSVYGTGHRTRPTGAIFTDIREGEFDDSLPYVYGMDFGYVNDPTTLIKVAKDDKNIYVKEELFKEGLSTGAIVDILRDRVEPTDLIVADSAEQRLIDEIREKDFNIIPCKKGPDSVRLGLVKMMDYCIVYSREDHNIRKELNKYVWNDKKSNTPIDKYNHTIDAMRYAFDELSRSTETFFF